MLGRVKKIRNPYILGSMLLFAIGLLLPSYSHIDAEGRTQIQQIGIQSLLSPPMGMEVIVNILFALAIRIKLLPMASNMSYRLVATLLATSWMVCCFAFVLGDPQPGSKTAYGPGAMLWNLAILTAIVAPRSKLVA